MLEGIRRKFKPLEILTEEEVNSIHAGTLQVLENTGVKFESKKALRLLEQNGCKVNFDTNIVKFPPALVEECLRKCPSGFRVKARDPKYDIFLGGNTLHYGQSVGNWELDLDTGEPRTATLKDHGDAIRVLDALDNCHYLWGWEFYMEMEDIPPNMVMLEGLASGLRNSPKVETFGHQFDCEVFALEMAEAVGMDLCACITAQPPLTESESASDAIFRFADAGMPLIIISGITMGGTGPATIAGSLVSYNADLMAAIVLAQLYKPGTKLLVSDFTLPMNMSTGSPDFNTVINSLHDLAFQQVFRKYQIPIHSGVSAFGSSKIIDYQSGSGRCRGEVISALGSKHLSDWHGAVFGELTYSPAMSVLDEDMVIFIKRFLEGVEVNDETLALDLINEVGPIPGHFLSKEHTRKWWQKEWIIPRCDDRDNYDVWIAKGKPTALENARSIAKELMATHKPVPLSSSQEAAIESILKKARKFYKEKGMI